MVLAVRERLFFASLLAFGVLPAISVVPWLADSSPGFPPPSLHGIPLCACLCPNFLFYQDASHVGIAPAPHNDFS